MDIYISFKKLKVLLFTLILLIAANQAYSQDFIHGEIQYTIIDKDAYICSAVNCTGNSKSYAVPSVVTYENVKYSVVEIGERAFAGMHLLESVSLPSTLKKIGKQAFYECINLSYINLPESLTEIGDYAFYKYNSYYDGPYYTIQNWSDPKSDPVKIPDGVSKIGKGAFMRDYRDYQCSTLRPANIPSSLTEIEDFAFCNNSPTDMTLPPKIIRIGESAFQTCMANEIEIPDAVQYIGDNAFYASSITDVKLPSSLFEMGKCVFKNCESLTSVSIPQGLKAIGESAFANSPIHDISFPSSVTHIGDSAFYHCNLLAVELPQNLDKINDCVFSDNLSLASVKLPPSITSIGYSAFNSCALKEIYVPSSVVSIGDYAFSNAISNSITIADGVQSIGDLAFYKCEFSEISLPNSVHTLGSEAFSGCNQLDTVVLSDGIEEMSDFLFNNCTELKSVSFHSSSETTEPGVIDIPNGVKILNKGVFANCQNISIVKIPASVERMTGNPFIACDNLEKILVDVRNTHYKIEEDALLSINGDTLVSFPGDFSGHFKVPLSVSTIGCSAFEKHKGLTSITLHDGVRCIQAAAFALCENLASPDIPKYIEWIGGDAFNGVYFRNINLPNTLKYLGHSAFNCNYGLSPSDRKIIESVRIYGTFVYLDDPFSISGGNIEKIYYLTKYPQRNGENIYWGSFPRATLYVLEETYDEILTGHYTPWSYLTNIEIYDPSDDPFFSSIEDVDDNIDFTLPIEVYNLEGVRVSCATDNLPSGIYIIRQGLKVNKTIIK